MKAGRRHATLQANLNRIESEKGTAYSEFYSKLYYIMQSLTTRVMDSSLDQWFSTGVPRNTGVP